MYVRTDMCAIYPVGVWRSCVASEMTEFMDFFESVYYILTHYFSGTELVAVLSFTSSKTQYYWIKICYIEIK